VHSSESSQSATLPVALAVQIKYTTDLPYKAKLTYIQNNDQKNVVCSLPLDGEIRDPVLQIVILGILRGHLSNAIFLQDGAKPYTADDILSLLRLRNKKIASFKSLP